jgi:hypothetical protein
MYPFLVNVEIIRFCANSLSPHPFSRKRHFYSQNSLRRFPHFFCRRTSRDMPDRCSCHRPKCPTCGECSRCSCKCNTQRRVKWSRRISNNNNISYAETSEGEGGFVSPPASARARNTGTGTTRSSSKSAPRTRSSRSSNISTPEPSPITASIQLKTIRDIREALGLSECSGRGIPSWKD